MADHGSTLWYGGCDGCHNPGGAPPWPQKNAAGTSGSTIQFALPVMGCAYASGLDATQRSHIALYLFDQLPAPINVTTSIDVNEIVNVTGYLQTGTNAFTHVATATNPEDEVSGSPVGSLTFSAGQRWTGYTNTFNPPAGYTGYVTFQYRGVYFDGVSTLHFGNLHTARIRVGSVPIITSGAPPSGTVGTPYSYTITATQLPTSFGHTTAGPDGLPTGTSRSGAVISGTPTVAGVFTSDLSATNGVGTDVLPASFTINPGTPTLHFDPASLPPPSRTYSPGGTFFLTPPATFTGANAGPANTALNPVYTSLTPATCTTAGTTSTLVTIVAAGNCRVRASTAATANWNASNQPFLDTPINQASQTVSFPAGQGPVAWSPGGGFAISPLATTTAAAQPGIAITYSSNTPAVCSVAGSNVTILRAGLCQVLATEDGNGNYTSDTATQNITINAVLPGAPAIGVATPGDTQASIAFTPLDTTNDGGASILQYTATCNPGGITGTNATSPITVNGLTNAQLYTCSVTATQVAPHSLTGPASGTVGVTPQPTPVPPNITSANNTTFMVGVAGSFNITATGVPAPTISINAPLGLPAGVSFNGPGTSPRTLSGTPASGTVGSYPIDITADGTNPDALQSFTLTVARRSQTVSMVDPPDSLFGTGNVPLSATATSGLPVTFTSLTPAVCGIAGSNATLLNVGTCTIQGSQVLGDADWAPSTPAAGDTQSFTISAGPQTINFGTQVPATRVIAPGQTFNVNPTASATPSGLTVTYSTSTTPTVCTAMGGIAIRMDNVGTCTIVASQSGNAQYQAATPVPQNVTLTVASQTITFPAQAAQDYSPGGTFPISPVAFSSSGLTIAYFSDTPSICTISGSLVTIVTTGTCSIRAEQPGDGNFTAAAPVSATIQINAVVPQAPTIGASTPGNQHAKIEFTPPSNDGGSPITSYRATCGGVTGTGTTSPITVNGLVNGTPYTCTVAAQNSVGFSAESGTVGVMPSLQGAALWTANCHSCHGTPPGGARFNAAGASTSTSVLDYVIANNPQMNIASLNALNALERQDLKQYITSFLMSSFTFTDSTAPNTPKVVNLGGHLALNTAFPNAPNPDVPGSFSHVVVEVQPTNGTLTLVNGVEFLYTPNPGFTGTDSFQYRGQRDSPASVTGDSFVFNINVTAAAQVLTIARNGTGGGLVFSDTPTSGIDCGADCVEAYATGTMVSLIAVADPGSTFIGWSGGGCAGSSPVCNVAMSAAQNVTATFNLTPFDLTVARTGAGTGSVSSSPAGITCGATCTAGFPPGTVVTLTPTPAAGSAFTGWSGACTGAGACNVTMDATRGVTANFEPTYVLSVAKSGTGTGTVSSSPAGVDCGATCSAEFITGTLVTLTPTPAVGSAFTGWSGACTGTGACSVTMTVARSVTANFTPTYTLSFTKLGNGSGTVSSNPAGINACGTACSADFLDGTVVTLAATIGPDTDFLGWGGACSGTGACVVTMSAARSVTANFKSSIALTVNRIGTGSGVVTSAPDGVGIGCGASCTVGFDPGTVVTLGVSPAAGSVFAGWSGACTGSGACILTMSQSRSVTATFNLASGPQADVSIVAHGSTPPAAASVGQQVTFTLTVANNGPSAATAVVLTDNIPAGSTFVSASPACSHAAGVVTCALGTLASGASIQLDVTVQPTVAGGATNFASVTAAEGDPLSFNNASALAISVTGANNVRLSNISTRMQVQGGAGALIGGFVIGGSSSKTVAIVVTGPSLAAHGITSPLANPAVTLVRSSDQVVIATNDDWQSAPNAAQLQAAGFAPPNAQEAAILVTLAPGAYTALVSGGTGVAVLGVYEVDQPQVRLINISTRGNVLTGNNVMIGGFVISGNAPQTVAIQGIGPSLSAFGITNPLPNPTITLVRSSDQAVLAANDDWETASNASALQAAGLAPTNALESGLLVTLPPGAYTVILSGVGSTTGIGIIGIYTFD